MARRDVFSRRPAATEFVTPLGIPKNDFRKWKRRWLKRGRGGSDHMFGDVNVCGEDDSKPESSHPPPPPPQAEGASLRFAISGVFNPGVERSAGPTSKAKAPSWYSDRGNIEDD